MKLKAIADMTETKKTGSVYFRTTLLLTACTMIVFAVLCIAYYQQMSRSVISQESESLYDAAVGAAEGYVRINTGVSGTAAITTEADNYFCALAVANNCYIWIVEPDGRIYYNTEIPDEARKQLSKVGKSYYMTDTQLSGLTDKAEGGFITGSQNGMFSDSRYVWLSASYPVTSTGWYLVVHKSIDAEQEAMWMLSNALALPVLISFALALVIFTLMTRSLIRPIRLLSDAAKRVTSGDLTARIHIPELEKETPVQYGFVDEMSELIMTVNQMIERLERQDNERRVFISSIAHDLRTPLTSIKGFLSAMLDGTVPPERFEYYLGITKTEVDRIQALTTSMTDATSLGKKDSLKIVVFDINDLIKSTLTSLEKMLQDKNLGVQLECYTDQNDGLPVKGDREAIMRVVNNLLVNAIKFTPSNGDIAISTEYHAKTGQVFVTVEDSGPGIPKDKRARVFESFYKIDESRTNPGSGLGLYICKEILRAHDQTIRVDASPIFGGARFVFTLASAYDSEKDRG